MANKYIFYFIGYAYSLLIGQIYIKCLSNKLWEKRKGKVAGKENSGIFEHSELRIMVGIFERVLYTSSILLNKPEFIALWLALKVAGGFNVWSKGFELEGGIEIPGRAVFQYFYY